MHDSLLQVIAPALPLQQLLNEGSHLARKLRQPRRGRKPQMIGLVEMINEVSN